MSSGRDAAIRVLVVDDDDLFRALVRVCLAGDGRFHVAGEARNGNDALELVDLLQIEAVVVDFEMPVMDGLVFCTEARSRWPAMHLVMLTGSEIDVDLPEIVRKERFDPHALCDMLARV
jgi:CheY-like chemotaxis protein